MSKTSVGGLLFTAFSLVFVVAGIAMVVKSAHQAATYLPATATVDRVTGADEASDKVSVAYSFSVNGKRYTGTESADDDKKLQFNELRQYKVGQQLTVYLRASRSDAVAALRQSRGIRPGVHYFPRCRF